MTNLSIDIDDIVEEINERDNRRTISRVNINIVRRKICIILTGVICLGLIAIVVVILKTSIIN